MTVSAIVPVWNGAAHLADALGSILAQTRAPDEVLVVDDGSTDETPTVAARFPNVRYHRQENRGPGPARNLGLNEAKGDVVAFLDHDDLWLPRKLELQLEILAKDPRADGVSGWIENFVSEELSPEEKARIQCPKAPSNGLASSTLVIRKPVFDRVGLWPASQREGVEWFQLARESGVRFIEVPEVLARRRLHLTNRTRLGTDHNRDYLRIARESLLRKRGGLSGSSRPIL